MEENTLDEVFGRGLEIVGAATGGATAIDTESSGVGNDSCERG